ncbi:MAG: aromatic ring-hydroxylating dioxygenase subunit alpha [Pseudomonadota bacterium]
MNAHDHFASVLAPITEARGLSNEHYTSPTFFEAEKRAVFFDNWSGIGFGKDVPEPGDVKPIDFLGLPVLLARDQEGMLHVYQNTCRHRGMILVEEPTNIRGVIRCPYHSWCYSLKGDLKTTPHVGGPGQNVHESVDRSELGLIEIRSHVWHDVIFVNVSANRPAFETDKATLIARWREFEKPVFHGGADSSFTLDVKTNWKLAVENYCESYHLPWVHPGLNSYSRLEDHYHIEEDGQFSGQGTLVYRQLKAETGETFPDFNGLSEYWNEGAEYIAVYPNVLMGVHRDHMFSIVIQPKDAETSVEHVEIYYPEPIADETEFNDLRQKNAVQWKGVFVEDVFVVEGMQRGRHGLLFDGGKFSPVMDNPTHLFHQWVARQLYR